jgi:hypothetical protein
MIGSRRVDGTHGEEGLGLVEKVKRVADFENPGEVKKKRGIK